MSYRYSIDFEKDIGPSLMAIDKRVVPIPGVICEQLIIAVRRGVQRSICSLRHCVVTACSYLHLLQITAVNSNKRSIVLSAFTVSAKRRIFSLIQNSRKQNRKVTYIHS